MASAVFVDCCKLYLGVTTHSENKFANTTATFGKRDGHIRLAYHVRQTAKLQTRNGTDAFCKRNSANGDITNEKYKFWTPMLCRISRFNFFKRTHSANGIRQTAAPHSANAEITNGKGFRAKHDVGIEAVSKDVKHERRLPKQQIRLCIEPRFGSNLRIRFSTP